MVLCLALTVGVPEVHLGLILMRIGVIIWFLIQLHLLNLSFFVQIERSIRQGIAIVSLFLRLCFFVMPFQLHCKLKTCFLFFNYRHTFCLKERLCLYSRRDECSVQGNDDDFQSGYENVYL